MIDIQIIGPLSKHLSNDLLLLTDTQVWYLARDVQKVRKALSCTAIIEKFNQFPPDIRPSIPHQAKLNQSSLNADG